ncbi:MAG: hypothetical protein ACREKN_09715 [Longimicrobiaceae bacterium]
MSCKPSDFAPAVLGVALLLAAPAGSQGADNPGSREVVVYEREVFRYDRAGRRDPFRSLIGTEELAIRVEDLVVRGVILNPDARRSVAVLRDQASNRQVRVRVGDRVGSIRVLAIRRGGVEVAVEELGVVRRETLPLERERGGGG